MATWSVPPYSIDNQSEGTNVKKHAFSNSNAIYLAVAEPEWCGGSFSELMPFMHCYPSFLRRMRGSLQYLRLFGFFPCPDLDGDRAYPFPFHPKTIPTKQNGGIKFRSLLWLYSFVLVLLNCGTFYLALGSISACIEFFGLLNAFTVSGIITGIKPLINTFNLLTFLINYRRHRVMLSTLQKTYEQFPGNMPKTIRTLNMLLFSAVTTMALLLFLLRIFEFVWAGEKLGSNWQNDLSILLIPLISIWGSLPLIYFAQILYILWYWSHQLHKSVGRQSLEQQPIKDPYKRLLQLTNAQSKVSDMFGAWIFGTLAWAVFTLCLSIYFVTHLRHGLFSLPEILTSSYTPTQVNEALLTLQFNVAWSTVQIGVAVLHISIICYLGTTVNEEVYSKSVFLKKSICRYAYQWN